MAATAIAGVLHLLWALFLATGGGDLAAQSAWAEFALRHPGSAYDFAWYGGMHPASYSVISPYLMALLGVRTTGVIAGTLSAAPVRGPPDALGHTAVRWRPRCGARSRCPATRRPAG